MNIRIAVPEDLDGCVKISHVPELSYLYTMPDAEVKAYLQLFSEQGILIVAEDKGEILGFLNAEFMLGNFAWIDGITVREELRGIGLGKQLLASCKDELRKRGIEHIFLMAPKQNTATLGFYRSAGMQEGQEFIEFYEKL